MSHPSPAALVPLVLAALSVPTLAADAAPDAATYLLRYDFSKLPAVHYRVVQNAKIVTKKGELRDDTATAEETDKHFRVISVDEDGVALLESRIDRTRMAVQFDDAAPVRWDSRSEADPPKQFKGVQQQVGRPLARMQVSARGELLSLARIGKTNGDEADAVDASSNVLVEFPKDPIRIGDTWRQEFEVDVLVGRKITRAAKLLRTFELEKVEQGIATIGYKIAVTSVVVNPKVSVQLIQRTPSGKILFDVNRGLILSRSQSIDERVFGAFGAGSWMHARSNRNERLIERDEVLKTASSKE